MRQPLSAALLAVSTLAWGGQSVLGEPVGRSVPAPAATFPLAFSIASDEAPSEAIPAQVDSAVCLFAPFAVAFAPQGEPAALPPAMQHVETRADRDAFAAYLRPHAINVFVVSSLRDVDDPTQARRGVHWHGPGGTHYVILVATSGPQVLAHELGHFFGNPHTKVVDNLMSYERSGGWIRFDAAQGRRIVESARGYLASGELPDVGHPAR